MAGGAGIPWLPWLVGITASVYLTATFVIGASLPSTPDDPTDFFDVASDIVFLQIPDLPAWGGFLLFFLIAIPWVYVITSVLQGFIP